MWSNKLQYLAIDQWTREIPITSNRGEITDRNGVVLATNKDAYTVYARVNAIKDLEYTSRVLANIFSLDADELLQTFKTKKASEITVAKKVDKSLINQLTCENLSGIYYARDNIRVYPYNDMLCQVIGFTSTDNSGASGLEKYYNKYLLGENGEILFETDLVGIELKNAVAGYKPATSGLNIRLTVDYEIQAIVEQTVKTIYLNHSPKSAHVILLDPNNFDVLAMCNYPSFDLNDVPRNDIQTLTTQSRNFLVCDIYEPGSTFKILTSAINIEEYYKGNSDAYSTQYVFNSSRTRSVGGTTIKCWSNHENGKHSNQTLAEALNNSCNPCFTDIAMALKTEKMYEYFEKFNLGKVTGLDFSGEALGMLISKGYVTDADLARIGFGQSIAVTPLQLICAVASVINGGYYYKPSLVKQIYQSSSKTEYSSPAELVTRTVSEQTSITLNKMLEGVVSSGSGTKAYIEGYKVAGKTGTAQVYENGKIASGKYISSFVGFFPSNKPQYLALIIVNEPTGSYYGSTVAAPYGKEIFEGIISAKNIQKFE